MAEQWESTCQTLEKELDSCSERHAREMEDVFAKLNKTAETSGLEKSVTELKTELESFKMKNKRLETENEWWKSEKQQVLTEKENECRELKENIVSTQARHSAAIERTQSELATASKENERLMSQNELFRAQLVEKEKINSELLSKTSKSISDLRCKLTTSREETLHSKDEAKRLRIKLDQTREARESEMKRLIQKIERVRARFESEQVHVTLQDVELRQGSRKSHSKQPAAVGDYEGGFTKVPHGHGKFTSDSFSYQGNFEKGVQSGKGKETLANGDVFKGHFGTTGKFQKGKVAYTNGDIFRGEWNGGKTCGRTYSGELLNGKRHGQGKMVFPNGSVYTGNWSNGSHHGFGKMRFASGRIDEGQWSRVGKMAY
eukprot:758538_1